MERGMITAKGPSVGTYRERDIPAWIDARGGHYVYDRPVRETSGGVDLKQLARDELVIAPGLIYKRASDSSLLSTETKK